jgi:hypothetical protein
MCSMDSLGLVRAMLDRLVLVVMGAERRPGTRPRIHRSARCIAVYSSGRDQVGNEVGTIHRIIR